MRRQTTYLFFSRCSGRAFPRWAVSHSDGAGGIVNRSFNSKLGCWLYARRLGRIAGYLT